MPFFRGRWNCYWCGGSIWFFDCGMYGPLVPIIGCAFFASNGLILVLNSGEIERAYGIPLAYIGGDSAYRLDLFGNLYIGGDVCGLASRITMSLSSWSLNCYLGANSFLTFGRLYGFTWLPFFCKFDYELYYLRDVSPFLNGIFAFYRGDTVGY